MTNVGINSPEGTGKTRLLTTLVENPGPKYSLCAPHTPGLQRNIDRKNLDKPLESTPLKPEEQARHDETVYLSRVREPGVEGYDLTLVATAGLQLSHDMRTGDRSLAQVAREYGWGSTGILLLLLNQILMVGGEVCAKLFLGLIEVLQDMYEQNGNTVAGAVGDEASKLPTPILLCAIHVAAKSALHMDLTETHEKQPVHPEAATLSRINVATRIRSRRTDAGREFRIEGAGSDGLLAELTRLAQRASCIYRNRAALHIELFKLCERRLLSFSRTDLTKKLTQYVPEVELRVALQERLAADFGLRPDPQELLFEDYVSFQFRDDAKLIQSPSDGYRENFELPPAKKQGAHNILAAIDRLVATQRTLLDRMQIIASGATPQDASAVAAYGAACLAPWVMAAAMLAGLIIHGAFEPVVMAIWACGGLALVVVWAFCAGWARGPRGPYWQIRSDGPERRQLLLEGEPAGRPEDIEFGISPLGRLFDVGWACRAGEAHRHPLPSFRRLVSLLTPAGARGDLVRNPAAGAT